MSTRLEQDSEVEQHHSECVRRGGGGGGGGSLLAVADRIMGGSIEASLKAVNGTLKSVNRMPQKLLVLLAVVSTNLLALYTILGYSRGFPEGGRLERLHLARSASYSDHSTIAALAGQLNATRQELRRTEQELARVRDQLQTAVDQQQQQQQQLSYFEEQQVCARCLPDGMRPNLGSEMEEYLALRKLPLGWNPSLATDLMSTAVGHMCVVSSKQVRDDLLQFMQYNVGEACPDDEVVAQRLLLAGCEPLPRRRCFARSPAGENYSEPLPLPASLWLEGRQPEAEDGSFLWGAYQCKSFECLNGRAKLKVFADCLDCFDLAGREARRWESSGGTAPGGASALDFTVEEVLALKKGTIRIGLDIGGGTGSFAVRMREQQVTIVTTTLNLGGPFNNFVARRGVLPLYMTVSQRLPFWDNTLDLVHSMHVLSNWIPDVSLQFILFDIDRVLRPGGILWLDHFFCLAPQLNSTYLPMIQSLGYNKLKWVLGAKLDRGAELQEMYLSALLEKPLIRNF